MEKIGFTSQGPQKKDYRQDPLKVEKFKKEKVPAIKKNQMKKSACWPFKMNPQYVYFRVFQELIGQKDVHH